MLIIKTTLATVVLLIATTNATKLNDKTKPPSNPGRPDFLIILKVSLLYVAKRKAVRAIRKKKI